MRQRPNEIRHALGWAIENVADAAIAASDWLAKDICPECDSAITMITSPQTTLRQLEQAKDAYKTMRVLGETAADRRMGGRLYLAAIAAGIVVHQKRISRQSDRALRRALADMVSDDSVAQPLRLLAKDALQQMDSPGSMVNGTSNGNGYHDPDDEKDEDTVPLEIERTYLLDRLPNIPPEAWAIRIEQGYLSDEAELDGRLRREIQPDGTVRCTHTIKSGRGLVRQEVEREISEQEFKQHWPATNGQRLTKVRYCVPVGDLTWEIDAFNELKLVLAEVELPTINTKAPPPPWLQRHIVREVTEEKQYRNHALARRLASGEGVHG